MAFPSVGDCKKAGRSLQGRAGGLVSQTPLHCDGGHICRGWVVSGLEGPRMQASHSLTQLHKAPLLEELQVSCDHSGGGGLLTADTITDVPPCSKGKVGHGWPDRSPWQNSSNQRLQGCCHDAQHDSLEQCFSTGARLLCLETCSLQGAVGPGGGSSGRRSGDKLGLSPGPGPSPKQVLSDLKEGACKIIKKKKKVLSRF